jgi:hypothetical protein
MIENDVLSSIADAVTEETIKFKIQLREKSRLDELLIKLKIKKPYKSFELKPITLGKMIQISKLLLSIPVETIRLKEDFDAVYKLGDKYGETIAKIISIAVHPKKDTPASLPRFISDNLSQTEIRGLSFLVLKSLNISDFVSTIVTLKGIQILKSSEARPQVPGSTSEQ